MRDKEYMPRSVYLGERAFGGGVREGLLERGPSCKKMGGAVNSIHSEARRTRMQNEMLATSEGKIRIREASESIEVHNRTSTRTRRRSESSTVRSERRDLRVRERRATAPPRARTEGQAGTSLVEKVKRVKYDSDDRGLGGGSSRSTSTWRHTGRAGRRVRNSSRVGTLHGNASTRRRTSEWSTATTSSSRSGVCLEVHNSCSRKRYIVDAVVAGPEQTDGRHCGQHLDQSDGEM